MNENMCVCVFVCLYRNGDGMVKCSLFSKKMSSLRQLNVGECKENVHHLAIVNATTSIQYSRG